MATTNARGNQGSTEGQDPEPQQEILASGADIRASATARAGFVPKSLVVPIFGFLFQKDEIRLLSPQELSRP